MALINCPECKKEVSDQSSSCPHCGYPISRSKMAATHYEQQYATPVSNNDGSSFGFAFLGFMIPLIGLILYLVWKDDKPLKAASAGKGALIGAVIGLIFFMLI